ncbi:MAG: ATP-binding protein [Gemmatimonadaceae bacterium]|jgi:signal transduction histidine kinase|nr:ATP-binding protein [Gemmatimonadaceae bacterium]
MTRDDVPAPTTDDPAADQLISLVRFEAEARRFRDVLTSLSLVSWPDLDTALESICRAAAEAMGVARVSVWRYDRARSAIFSGPRWHNGIPGWDAHVITATTHPVYWQALHERRVLAIEDAVRDPVLAEFRDHYTVPLGIGAMLDTGIRAERQTLGIVCVEHVGGPRAWSVAEQEFAASVGDRVGLALALDEQRRLEADLRQTQKMEAIGLLAGGVAHDFNNILNVILASAELARDGLAAGDDVGEDLASITAAAHRAAGLTRKLLFIARRETTVREQADLNEIVRGFRPMAASIVDKRVAITLALAEQALPVLADRTFLDQALLNLVSNAGHAMPEGGELTLETGIVEHDGARITFGTSLPAGRFGRLTVRDTGIGMSSEQLRRIFEPFYTTKGAGGTGLGLAIVYGGMRQHDGHVAAESEAGRGTAFHLLFPLAL